MNAFVLVLIIPALLTVVSASTLYFSFKGSVDTSGRYFLLAEFLWLITLLLVITLNVQPSFVTTPVFFSLAFSTLLSEVAILFSIKALTKKVYGREFIYWILFLVAYCGFSEYCRNYINPRLPLLFFSLFSLCITGTTYIACKRINSNGLEANIFIKWIIFTELGLAGIHVLRFASFFSGTPMMTINPPTLPIIVFSIWLAINLFRYFSYLALRVSWVDARSSIENPLNQHLVRLINEKNQFLQGLMSSNRALGISALANSLAHQLSQPITGVILQTESVKRSLSYKGDQENSVQILNTVTEQLGKVTALINNLRKLFGAHELEFKDFYLKEACDEVLEFIEPTLKSKNISLVKSYEGNLVTFGSAIQIQQVLINIFNNAIDAIENAKTESREIGLRIYQDQATAVIAIKDTGTGIAPDIASMIFELYQSTKADGLGIGLWLCKAIIDKHEGKIAVLNNPLGGTIFEIYLPLAKDFHQTN